MLWCLGGCNQHIAGRPHRINLLQYEEDIEKKLYELEELYDTLHSNPVQQGIVRDRFARKMIELTDLRYSDFLDEIVQGRKGFDASSDVIAIGLDTASVIFTPASTKSILAGMSGLTTASKTAINKVYFYEQTLPVVIAQMSAERQMVLADIHVRLSGDTTSYPLRRLLSDLHRYYSAGTIDGAIEKIQRSAAETAQDAESRMKELADADIEASRDRARIALAQITNEASFSKLRTKIANWWGNQDEDTQFEQVDVINTFAISHGVPANHIFTTDDDGNEIPKPDGFGAFLDSLDPASQVHRLMLADIARNAAGLALSIEP